MDIKIGDYVELVVAHTDPALEYASGPFLVQDIHSTPTLAYLLLFPEGSEWVELAQTGLSLRPWKRRDAEVPPEAEEPTHNTLFDVLLGSTLASHLADAPAPPPLKEEDFRPGGGDYGGAGATVAYEEPSSSEAESTPEPETGSTDSSTSDNRITDMPAEVWQQRAFSSTFPWRGYQP